eukprot:gene6038-15617_t
MEAFLPSNDDDSAYLDVAEAPDETFVASMPVKELKDILRQRGVNFIGVSEKRELVELVMNSNDSTEADAATIQANREKEMESGGILFTSTEDALADQYDAKIAAMSSSELKKYLLLELKVEIPSGLTEKAELVKLALEGRPSTVTKNIDMADDVAEHLLDC